MLLDPLGELESWASEANLKSRVLHIPNSNEQLYPPMRHSGMGAHGGILVQKGGIFGIPRFILSNLNQHNPEGLHSPFAFHRKWGGNGEDKGSVGPGPQRPKKICPAPKLVVPLIDHRRCGWGGPDGGAGGGGGGGPTRKPPPRPWVSRLPIRSHWRRSLYALPFLIHSSRPSVESAHVADC